MGWAGYQDGGGIGFDCGGGDGARDLGTKDEGENEGKEIGADEDQDADEDGDEDEQVLDSIDEITPAEGRDSA